MSPSYDLCAIGNALVDMLISTDDAFLQANSIVKGSGTLIDDAPAQALYQRSGAKSEMSSGGSAANTLAGFVSLGGKGAFMSKVGSDFFGDIFANDLRVQDIHFADARTHDLPTGRCLVFITPDAQRSMCAFLGAATEFGSDDVDEAVIRDSAITYLEGYLFDKDSAKAALRKAAKIAHGAGRKMALTLSDAFCVSRHRDEFLTLIRDDIDILFANESELCALYQTDDLARAIKAARKDVEISVTTRGAEGALIAAEDKIYEIPAQPVAKVIDTTGAGDLYAAGFLYGVSKGMDLPQAGRIGAIAAAEIISHFGPRPQVALSTLLAA